MQLLITQLTHQDPTKPKEDTEFIAQLATFSQLEKLTSIADSIKQLDTISESMARLENKVASLETALKAASGRDAPTASGLVKQGWLAHACSPQGRAALRRRMSEARGARALRDHVQGGT